MLATQLHEIVRDFAGLPGSRLALLEALPGYVEKHFGATGIVSVLHDGQLRVLASSDPRYRPGCEPPEAAELSASTSAGDSFERYRPDCPEHPYMVAWPLHERAGIIAVLQLLCREPLQEVSQVTLGIFTQLISAKLTDTSRSRQAAAVAELVTALYTSSSLEDAAQLALDLICGFMDAEAGYLLQARAGSMTPLANSGFAAADERALRIGIGQPYPEGLAWQACIGGQPLWLPVAGSESGPLSLPVVTVVQPIGWRGHYRYVLWLGLRPRGSGRSSLDRREAAVAAARRQLERSRRPAGRHGGAAGRLARPLPLRPGAASATPCLPQFRGCRSVQRALRPAAPGSGPAPLRFRSGRAAQPAVARPGRQLRLLQAHNRPGREAGTRGARRFTAGAAQQPRTVHVPGRPRD